MRFRDAVRWGLYDRLLATFSLVAGLVLAIGGLWLGTSDWVASLVSGNPGATPSGGDAAIALGGIVVGLAIWQIGSAAARHRTMVTATKRELDGVDVGDSDGVAADEADRLAQLETDVEEVRRVAARIEKSMRDGEFDAAALNDGGGTTSAGAGSSGGASVGAAGVGAAATDHGGTATGNDDADEAATSGDADAATSSGDADAATTSGETDAATTSSDTNAATATDDATADAAHGADATAAPDDTEPTPAQELGAPEIEFSDEPGETERTDATADAPTSGDDAVGDGGTVEDDAGDATAAGDASDAAGASDAGDGADDGFEWPDDGEEEYYRNS